MENDKPLNDQQRLRVLRHTRLMDSGAEVAFNRLTELARDLINVPVALVSLVDEHRQYFKSAVGLEDPWKQGTPLTHSFCQHVVNSGEPLVIDDVTNNELVRGNLAITDLGVRSYAGMPIKSRDGFTLGSFCVISNLAHEWTDRELNTLEVLANICMEEVEMRRLLAEKTELAERFDNWVARMPLGALVCDEEMTITSWNPAAERIFGYKALEAIGQKPWRLLFKPEAEAAAKKRMADMAINGIPLKMVTLCVDKMRNEVGIEWTITAIFEPDGMFGGFIAMFENPHEQKIVPAYEL